MRAWHRDVVLWLLVFVCIPSRGGDSCDSCSRIKAWWSLFRLNSIRRRCQVKPYRILLYYYIHIGQNSIPALAVYGMYIRNSPPSFKLAHNKNAPIKRHVPVGHFSFHQFSRSWPVCQFSCLFIHQHSSVSFLLLNDGCSEWCMQRMYDSTETECKRTVLCIM